MATPLLLLGVATPAATQVVTTAPGVSRGLFGAGSAAPGASDLSLTIDLTGGHEGIDTPTTDTGGALGPLQSGYLGEAGGLLRYGKGRGDTFLLVTGNGSATQQQIATDLPSFRLYRGGGSVEGGTRLGRRSGLTIAANAAYEPTYAFGVFSQLDRAPSVDSPIDATPLPTEDAPLSVTRQRWLSSGAGAGAFHNWTSRQRMSARWETYRIRPIEGPGFEINRNTAALYHVWNVRQTVRLDASYRFDDIPQRAENTIRPVRTQTLEARARFEHRINPGRSVALQLGGGAVEVRTARFEADPGVQQVSPVASASITADLARTWHVGVSGRHDVTVLNGLSPEPFRTDEGLLSLDGTVGRRLWLATTGGVSRGRARRAGLGDFDLVMFNAQLLYGLGPRFALLARYAYNDHEFRNVSVAPTSFPLRFTRNSLRVGVTLWLPLYGTF